MCVIKRLQIKFIVQTPKTINCVRIVRWALETSAQTASTLHAKHVKSRLVMKQLNKQAREHPNDVSNTMPYTNIKVFTMTYICEDVNRLPSKEERDPIF